MTLDILLALVIGLSSPLEVTRLTLSPLDGSYGSQTNTVKNNLPGGRVQKLLMF